MPDMNHILLVQLCSAALHMVLYIAHGAAAVAVEAVQGFQNGWLTAAAVVLSVQMGQQHSYGTMVCTLRSS